MLERAFAEACATQGIVPGTADYAHYMVTVHQSQGQPAVDVFRGLFPDNPGRAELLRCLFERSFRAAVDRTGLDLRLSMVVGSLVGLELGLLPIRTLRIF